jgi:alpha-amylase
VPDGIGELQMGSKVYFGPDLAPINGQPPNYVLNGLINAVGWVSRVLDVQGYRLDHVQGISVDFLRQLLNANGMQGAFAVGEYWDGVVAHVNDWISSPQWMQGRASAFDFPLYFTLLAMSNDPNFNMANLDHAGLAGTNPFRVVTFVENHDTESRRDLVPKNIQPQDKPLAYVYILTSEGFPCVFFKDYSTDPGCLGGQLRPIIDNLVWIHQNIAEGPTQQRWKSQDVFVFERLGGAHLLVGMNKNKGAAQRLANVFTGFGPNVTLHDYTGHGPDITSDAQGHVTLPIPSNAGGLGYVCYSVAGINSRFAATPAAVTQVLEGAADLDIKPAIAANPVQIGRIFCNAGQPIQASLQFDVTGWGPNTSLTLKLLDPAGNALDQKIFKQADQGAALSGVAAATGFYTWQIQAANPPAASPGIAYTLTTTYQAPQTVQ